MSGTPQTYEEYLQRLDEQLSGLERSTDRYHSLDERLDVLIQLQIAQLRFFSQSSLAVPGISRGVPPYNSRKYSLDVARTGPGEEIVIPGNSIVPFTDGTLEGINIRLNDPLSDPIPLREFNPIYQPLPFEKFYLETTAQAGHYLRLMILRGVPGGTVENPKVGIMSQSEWASETGTDVNLRDWSNNVSPGIFNSLTYNVPVDRTLFLTFIAWGINSNNPAVTGDLPQMGLFRIQERGWGAAGPWYYRMWWGANGGGAVSLTKPITIPGGRTYYAECCNQSGHLVDIYQFASGYEVISG